MSASFIIHRAVNCNGSPFFAPITAHSKMLAYVTGCGIKNKQIFELKLQIDEYSLFMQEYYSDQVWFFNTFSMS